MNLEFFKHYKLSADLVITYEGGVPTINIPSQSRQYIVKNWKAYLVISGFISNDNNVELLKIIKTTLSDKEYQDIISSIIKAKIILPRNYTSKSDKLIKRWEVMGSPSWFLHLSSIEESNSSDTFSYNVLTEKVKIKLPTPTNLNNESLFRTLIRRRSTKSFSRQAITINELSNLLFYTGGILISSKNNKFGDETHKKTAPSPGACHGTELYPVVHNVKGVKPGIYHYCAYDHSLNLIEDTPVKGFLQDVLYNQLFYSDAAVNVFYSYVIERVLKKYSKSRVYREIHYETAHYAQNFLLTGSAMNLGVSSTASFKDTLLESKLKIDGINEIPMYLTSAGKI